MVHSPATSPASHVWWHRRWSGGWRLGLPSQAAPRGWGSTLSGEFLSDFSQGLLGDGKSRFDVERICDQPVHANMILPSGKFLQNYGFNHHVSWEKKLTMSTGPCSIAMLNYHRVRSWRVSSSHLTRMLQLENVKTTIGHIIDGCRACMSTAELHDINWYLKIYMSIPSWFLSGTVMPNNVLTCV